MKTPSAEVVLAKGVYGVKTPTSCSLARIQRRARATYCVLQVVLAMGMTSAVWRASATPEDEGRLRALISELRVEAKAIEAESAVVKEQLVIAERERDTAQQAATLQAQQAEQNRQSAIGWQKAANEATLRAQAAEESRDGWRKRAVWAWSIIGLAVAGIGVAAWLKFPAIGL